MFAVNTALLEAHQEIPADEAWYSELTFLRHDRHRLNDKAMRELLDYLVSTPNTLIRQADVVSLPGSNDLVTTVIVEADEMKDAADYSLAASMGGLAMVGWELPDIRPLEMHLTTVKDRREHPQLPLKHLGHDTAKLLAPLVQQNVELILAA